MTTQTSDLAKEQAYQAQFRRVAEALKAAGYTAAEWRAAIGPDVSADDGLTRVADEMEKLSEEEGES